MTKREIYINELSHRIKTKCDLIEFYMVVGKIHEVDTNIKDIRDALHLIEHELYRGI